MSSQLPLNSATAYHFLCFVYNRAYLLVYLASNYLWKTYDYFTCIKKPLSKNFLEQGKWYSIFIWPKRKSETWRCIKNNNKEMRKRYCNSSLNWNLQIVRQSYLHELTCLPNITKYCTVYKLVGLKYSYSIVHDD